MQWVPGVKRPGCGVDHAPLSSAEVKEKVELHLYSPSGLSWPVLARTLHDTPPHLHRSLTRLSVPVFQFLCLPLTVVPAQRSLYPTVPRNEVDNEI